MLFINQIIFLEIVFWIFITAIAIQLFHHWFIFSRFAFYKAKEKQNEPVPVSVVISAKNEYNN
ncbi:MAG: hypothetical protein K8S16_06090, partial [Bacteroidales bacterium]|nr:hypothetical protein [Bacteroidales bacterium]